MASNGHVELHILGSCACICKYKHLKKRKRERDNIEKYSRTNFSDAFFHSISKRKFFLFLLPGSCFWSWTHLKHQIQMKANNNMLMHGHELWVTFYFYSRLCVYTHRASILLSIIILNDFWLYRKESRSRTNDNNIAVHFKWSVWMLSQSLIKLDQSIWIEILNQNSSSNSKNIYLLFARSFCSKANSTHKFSVIRMMWWFARKHSNNIYKCTFLPTRESRHI